MDNFRGDLTDISAKKEALAATLLTLRPCHCFLFRRNIGQVTRKLLTFIV